MPRHSETIIMLDGTEIRREVHSQDGILWIAYYGEIYIVENAGKYALEHEGLFIATRNYFKVIRKATIS